MDSTKIWVVMIEAIAQGVEDDVIIYSRIIGAASTRELARAMAQSVVTGTVHWCDVWDADPEYDEASDPDGYHRPDWAIRYDGDEVYNLSIRAVELDKAFDYQALHEQMMRTAPSDPEPAL